MDTELTVQETQEIQQAAHEIQAPVAIENLLQSTQALAMISRLAERYSNSDMVPEVYRKKPDNCFVALELASRMDVSPILVMQNLYIVKGKPSWGGQACKALIDGSGKFKDSKYILTGTKEQADRGCYLQAINVKTGELIVGTEITMQMVQTEGWISNTKWKSMPEQMLKYRAAAFFARTECPEVLMGFQTAEENEDTAKSDKKQVTIDATQNIKEM